MDRLNEIIIAQAELQRKLGFEFGELTVAERVSYVRDMVLAATDELHEALAETTWKPWTTGEPHIDEDRVVGECVDALHFILNIVLAARSRSAPETVAAELFHRYLRKNATNRDRADARYDGVSGKCPHCHRDLLETTPIETTSTSGETVLMCTGCHGTFPKTDVTT